MGLLALARHVRQRLDFDRNAERGSEQERDPGHRARRGDGEQPGQSMRVATPQRTALNLVTLPTPMIAPAIVWVVETGMPSLVARNSVNAPLVSAAKPPTGCNLATPMPSVRTRG